MTRSVSETDSDRHLHGLPRDVQQGVCPQISAKLNPANNPKSVMTDAVRNFEHQSVENYFALRSVVTSNSPVLRGVSAMESRDRSVRCTSAAQSSSVFWGSPVPTGAGLKRFL
ncbi:MAG TPA: hypothetical protein VGP72_32395 [Planctomycetota bacterium]|jgi:hypothetical protein